MDYKQELKRLREQLKRTQTNHEYHTIAQRIHYLETEQPKGPAAYTRPKGPAAGHKGSTKHTHKRR